MKLCSKCRQVLPLDNFTKNASKSDGLHHHCRECKRLGQAAWYTSHSEEHAVRTNKRRRVYMAKFRNIKSGPCVDCRVEYPWYMMDFDHLPGTVKIGNVSDMIASEKSERLIMEEIAKCEVVCSNCHRERTYRRLMGL